VAVRGDMDHSEYSTVQLYQLSVKQYRLSAIAYKPYHYNIYIGETGSNYRFSMYMYSYP